MSRERLQPMTDAEAAWFARVGATIAKGREARGLSIRETADLAHVSPAAVQQVEAGEASSLLTIRRVAQVVGVTVRISPRG